MAQRNGFSSRRNNDVKSGLMSAGLALAVAFTALPAGAQSDFEFEDPLAQMRAKIERAAPDTATVPTTGTVPKPRPERVRTTASADAAAARADAAARVDAIANSSGQTVLSSILLAIFGLLALAAIGLGVIWMLGRRKLSYGANNTKDRELYAVADGTRGRRSLQSGAIVTRNRQEHLDTSEEDDGYDDRGVAHRAAEMISDDEADFDYDDNRRDDAYTLEDEARPQTTYAAAAAEVSRTNPDNPTTWKRPNLDRLKQSIRSDWKKKDEGIQDEAHQEMPEDPETEEMRSEAKVFADLFGEEPAPASKMTSAAQTADAQTAAGQTPVLDMIDTYGDDEQGMPVAALQSAVAKAATVEPDKAAARESTADRAQALRRIKALRESLKAS